MLENLYRVSNAEVNHTTLQPFVSRLVYQNAYKIVIICLGDCIKSESTLHLCFSPFIRPFYHLHYFLDYNGVFFTINPFVRKKEARMVNMAPILEVWNGFGWQAAEIQAHGQSLVLPS